MSLDRYQGTSITAPSTFSGPGGSAWRVTLPPVGQRRRPDEDGTVDLFLLHIIGAHPLWDHWLASVIHLRPIAGVKPPHIRVSGATHELLIVALDPTEPLPGLDGAAPGWQPRYLTPIDVVEQFQVADDAIAAEILELAVRAMVDGAASPDQDWRSWWRASLGQIARQFSDGTRKVERS